MRKEFTVLLMLFSVLLLMGMGPPDSKALCEWGCTGHVGSAPLLLERGPGGVMTGHVGMVPIFLQTYDDGLTTGLIGRAETKIAESPKIQSKMTPARHPLENPALGPGVWANAPPWGIQALSPGDFDFPPD